MRPAEVKKHTDGVVFIVQSLPVSPKYRSFLLKYVISYEMLLENADESISSIRYLKASDVSEREYSWDSLVALDLPNIILGFRGDSILELSGGLLYG